jgi:hypothetical protein
MEEVVTIKAAAAPAGPRRFRLGPTWSDFMQVTLIKG